MSKVGSTPGSTGPQWNSTDSSGDRSTRTDSGFTSRSQDDGPLGGLRGFGRSPRGGPSFLNRAGAATGTFALRLRRAVDEFRGPYLDGLNANRSSPYPGAQQPPHHEPYAQNYQQTVQGKFNFGTKGFKTALAIGGGMAVGAMLGAGGAGLPLLVAGVAGGLPLWIAGQSAARTMKNAFDQYGGGMPGWSGSGAPFSAAPTSEKVVDAEMVDPEPAESKPTRAAAATDIHDAVIVENDESGRTPAAGAGNAKPQRRVFAPPYSATPESGAAAPSPAPANFQKLANEIPAANEQARGAPPRTWYESLGVTLKDPEAKVLVKYLSKIRAMRSEFEAKNADFLQRRDAIKENLLRRGGEFDANNADFLRYEEDLLRKGDELEDAWRQAQEHFASLRKDGIPGLKI